MTGGPQVHPVAIVTGGAGFLGSHVADELVREGYQVRVFDKIESPWIRPGQEMVLGDVADLDEISRAALGCSVMFHMAAVADLEAARRDPIRAAEVNIKGTMHALIAAHCAGVQRFMHASSVYVFSRGGSIYRATKRAAEEMVEELSGMYGLNSTILRFGSLYGPRADPLNAIRRIVESAVSQRRIDFWGDGSEMREYLHISDAARLAVAALDAKFSSSAVHICGPEPLTTRQMLEMVNEILGGDIDVFFEDAPFEGRYRTTPYSYRSNRGTRLMADHYVDLGIGLLSLIQETDSMNGDPW